MTPKQRWKLQSRLMRLIWREHREEILAQTHEHMKNLMLWGHCDTDHGRGPCGTTTPTVQWGAVYGRSPIEIIRREIVAEMERKQPR